MDLIREIFNSTPPNAPPSTGLELNAHPHQVGLNSGDYNGIPALGEGSVHHPMMPPPNFNHVQLHPQYMQPVYMNSQAGASIYSQYLPYQMITHNVPGAAAVSHPAAPSLVYNPPMMLPGTQYLRPVGVVNAGMAYSFTAPPSTAPPKNTSKPYSKKRSWKKSGNKQDKDHPYVKKPRNAYICFVDEQRQNVAAELNNTNNSVVNAVLGQRWRSMSGEEQVKYYKQAEAERQLHTQQHPNWSCKENYGKKRRRSCKGPAVAAAATATASVSQPQDDRQPEHTRVTSGPTHALDSDRCLSRTEFLPCDSLHPPQAFKLIPNAYLLESLNAATAMAGAANSRTQSLPPDSLIQSRRVEEQLPGIIENLDFMAPTERAQLLFTLSPPPPCSEPSYRN